MTPFPAATPLFDHLCEIAPLVNAAGRVFLFLDFDGTLAPIVEDPGVAAMPREIRDRLVALLQRKRFLAAIISGRSLADLQQRVGLDGLTYAGNHGLEIRGPWFSFIEPEGAERMRALQSLSRILEIRLRYITGTQFENKGLTASVHYRRARQDDREQIRSIVQETLASAAGQFQMTEGLEVLEIRPRTSWSKGTAARLILAASESPWALPICLGDDATDEDAFSALAEGITVKIGRAADTSAKYQLEQQDQVGDFFAWLAKLDDASVQ